MKNLTLFIFILFSFLLTARAQQELTDSQKQQIQSENILLNGGFEAGKTSWTSGAGTVTSSTTAIKGKRSISVSLSSQTLNVYQDSILYASQYAGSVQGLAYARVKTTLSTVKVCARQAGVTSSTLCVTHSGSGNWELLKVPFILSATSNGLSINTASNVTGTVLIDDAFVGAVDLKVDTNNISNWQSYTPTWYNSTTNPSVGNGSISGKWRRVGSDMEGEVIIRVGSTTTFGTGTIMSVDIPSGYSADTSVIDSVESSPGTWAALDTAVTRYDGILRMEGTTNKLFLMVRRQATTYPTINEGMTGTLPFTMSNGDVITIRYKIPIVGWASSGSIYSSTNADTSLAEYTPTFNSGFSVGTGGNASSKFWWYRDGQYMVISGGWRLGSSGASIGTGNHSITIPSGYSIDTSKLTLLDGYPNVGTVRIGDFSAGAERVASILVFNSSSNTLFIGNGANFNGITSTTPWTWAQDDFLSIEEIRVPIVGWENSNIIIGQFNGLESCTDTYQCTDSFSAYVDNTGVVSQENVEWITGNASITDGSLFQINLASGLKGGGQNLSNPMNCEVTPYATDSSTAQAKIDTFTSSTVKVRTGYSTSTSTMTKQPYHFFISCQKQGADFIGKTAKAVASDQNVRTNGLLKSVMYSGAFAVGTSTPLQTYGDWIQSISSSGTGQVTFNFKTNTFASRPTCIITGYKTGAETNSYGCNLDIAATNTASSVSFRCNQNSTTAFNVSADILCHGYSP